MSEHFVTVPLKDLERATRALMFATQYMDLIQATKEIMENGPDPIESYGYFSPKTKPDWLRELHAAAYRLNGWCGLSPIGKTQRWIQLVDWPEDPWPEKEKAK